LNQSRWLDDPAEMTTFTFLAQQDQVEPPEDVVGRFLLPKIAGDFICDVLNPALSLLPNSDNGDRGKVALGVLLPHLFSSLTLTTAVRRRWRPSASPSPLI
ncbi:MAG: hypothetical protein MUP16_02745, partial [Sedimentisphaerales bacterium]|nr:hypothetical protein [Sedimentisphaerales bacterium]